MRDHGGDLSFDPRLPVGWPSLRYRLAWQGSRLVVAVTEDRLDAHDGHAGVPGRHRGARACASYVVGAGRAAGRRARRQGPRRSGVIDDHPITGGIRADGSTITAGVPDPIVHEPETGELPAFLEQTPAMGPHIPQG